MYETRSVMASKAMFMYMFSRQQRQCQQLPHETMHACLFTFFAAIDPVLFSGKFLDDSSLEMHITICITMAHTDTLIAAPDLHVNEEMVPDFWCKFTGASCLRQKLANLNASRLANMLIWTTRLACLLITCLNCYCTFEGILLLYSNLFLKKFHYPNSQLTTPSRRRCKSGNIQIPSEQANAEKQIKSTEYRMHSYRMHLLIPIFPVFQPEPKAVFWVLCANGILLE